MVAPPVDTGGPHDTSNPLLRADTTKLDGMPGAETGVTACDGLEAGPIPLTSRAFTVKV